MYETTRFSPKFTKVSWTNIVQHQNSIAVLRILNAQHLCTLPWWSNPPTTGLKRECYISVPIRHNIALGKTPKEFSLKKKSTTLKAKLIISAHSEGMTSLFLQGCRIQRYYGTLPKTVVNCFILYRLWPILQMVSIYAVLMYKGVPKCISLRLWKRPDSPSGVCNTGRICFVYGAILCYFELVA